MSSYIIMTTRTHAFVQVSKPLIRSIAPQRLMRPRDCARALGASMAAKGYRLEIDWKWKGWDRAGTIYILDQERNCIYEDTYPRGNMMWGKADADPFSCNYGSSKHHALLAANEFMTARQLRPVPG